MADADLTSEPIADAIARGDGILRFACANGRENGPYDPNGFAILRAGRRVRPIRLAVEPMADPPTIIATFAQPLQAGDEVAP